MEKKSSCKKQKQTSKQEKIKNKINKLNLSITLQIVTNEFHNIAKQYVIYFENDLMLHYFLRRRNFHCFR